ncbi:hypothetical protein G9U51_10540 [Calidifontibacter sp. DB0510]|uniref:Serine/threonine protein kinase n=1 Tax=Metallococcus carri TaxID=1656884 RepID=A0A967B1A8_9MICO|nr:protein kinase family protein [Metallococcus carri]NHN56212.1 hypothetical protein [Metallococcus carri]NOP38737.1 hypothetical protein [Calidifontibacter sp. DB2511S]
MQGIAAGSTLAGRYALDRALATSEASETWVATDRTLDREVIATLFPRTSDNAAATLDSARRAAAVEDRHLPRVLDVGTEDDTSYVITEALHGAESLASMLQFDPLPPEEARRIIGEAASGLHTAAGRGLHHGALTPHELVRSRDGSVSVLGVATLAALSGEDDRPGDVASRDDTVALAECLYAALTGRWPGEKPVRGLPSQDRRVDGMLPPAKELVPDVPGDLDTLCSAVLNDDEGPRTPGELARQLAPWSPDQVTERDPSGPQRHLSGAAPRGSHRYVAPAAAAGAGAAGLAAAGAAGAARAGAAGRGTDTSAPTERSVSTDSDPTMVGRPAGYDEDDTGTFDATAYRGRDGYEDDDDGRLDPPMPLLQSGSDDPDQSSSKIALAIVAAFLVTALIFGVVGVKGLFSGKSSDEPQGGATSSATTTGAPTSATTSSSPSVPRGNKIAVSSVDVFDPEGNGTEHPELVKNVTDGNPSTEWMTRIYRTAQYSGLKSGSGLVLDLGKSQQVGSVKITITSNPSTIQVFVTDDPKDKGTTPFGTVTNGSGEQTVTGTKEATGRYVVLWITALSKGNIGGYREKIAEVEVLS